jgi:ribonuclease BN (tRNA processing enzyme)
VTELAFLGTGNFLADGRYWNSFVIDRSILVEPCPTVLPHLRRCGIGADELDVIALSHFHADHSFGWPFLLLEFVRSGRTRPLTVVGPPAIEQHFADMLDLGGLPNVVAAARSLDIRYREVDDGDWVQLAGARVRGVAVEHVPHLRCFGFLFDLGGLIVGYSGDTRPCDGLDELAQNSDVLVIECNDHHAPANLPRTHMDLPSVLDVHRRFPQVRLVLTHLGRDVDGAEVPNAITPSDFDVVVL